MTLPNLPGRLHLKATCTYEQPAVQGFHTLEHMSFCNFLSEIELFYPSFAFRRIGHNLWRVLPAISSTSIKIIPDWCLIVQH